MGIFIDPEQLPANDDGFIQLVFLLLVYGKVLMEASNLISDGSELLLLVPSLANVVGSVVLPVLGAVPDGAIVLFSGMGENAQEQLAVGVGALAGSTIMLITLPWALSILGGRVNIDEKGNAVYKRPLGAPRTWSKLSPSNGWADIWQTGIGISPAARTTAYTMLATSSTYLIIQIPAFIYSANSTRGLAQDEKPWALLGLVLALTFFVGYLMYQWNISEHDEVKHDKIAEITVKMGPEFEYVLREHHYQTALPGSYGTVPNEDMDLPDTTRERLKMILRPFFNRFDQDRTGTIDSAELGLLFSSLGEALTGEELRAILTKFDRDKSGQLDFEEFLNLVIENSMKTLMEGMHHHYRPSMSVRTESITDDSCSGGQEDEEEVPEDLADLPWETQQFRLKLRSFYMMALGTLLVLVFTDPMVEVLSEVGERTGIPAFYISFVLSPLVSNASEMIASYSYSQKKSSKTISISLATLLGAAIMNNSFVLSIFLILIYVKGLAWKFSAETISILCVEVVIGALALRKSQSVAMALAIVMLYPLSLALVYLLENVAGFD